MARHLKRFGLLNFQGHDAPNSNLIRKMFHTKLLHLTQQGKAWGFFERVDAHSASVAEKVYATSTPASDAKLGSILYEEHGGGVNSELPRALVHGGCHQLLSCLWAACAGGLFASFVPKFLRCLESLNVRLVTALVWVRLEQDSSVGSAESVVPRVPVHHHRQVVSPGKREENMHECAGSSC